MAWLLQNLVDGEPPGAYQWVPDETPLESIPAGQVRVETNPAGKVWDGASATLRDPTPPEIAAREAAQLAEAKAAKEALLRDSADAEMAATVRFSEAIWVAGRYGRVGAAGLTSDEAAVLTKVQAIHDKLTPLVAAVRTATTLAQVSEINW